MTTIKIEPETLAFTTPLTAESTDYIEITNDSDEVFAFKVKTTAPKLYCVRPTAGKVSPGETMKIEIIFLGLAEEPPKDSKCKDKFLVLTLPAPYDLDGKSVPELWSSLEAEFKKDMVSKKIKVKFTEAPIVDDTAAAAVTQPAVIASAPIVPEVQKEPIVEQVKQVIPDIKKDIVTPITEPVKAVPVQTPVKSTTEEKASTPVANYDVPLAKGQPTDSATSNSNILLLIAIVIFLLAWLYY
ncbi:similar to Saccharomyces cerevisiae YER120W SCS2 Integral ER membrane protein that regulates phospholipid metabolism via an interaction with the FFAT motif of Opi1p [Maudiozyma saulgeensis]|uniref:Similar to Saccharomyces cerevisiae YER120W SCS2 Integral ER membrane protein that regulates phospholipid metabolism via an interaction with the FFAT motif of Opi1p n=1 Tax=Maudiozyma saulgeensis TaxID=1789683 RepID=A0A1X7R6Q4_9SACH|nr:similar to Saccharomyces cerevisiae YER120W SCS2 Integral ER membrane protein that regulates phospholipid metabolism via an interaction with the FFAT motif of Opi1p [Kazachstania saulgeensis]